MRKIRDVTLLRIETPFSPILKRGVVKPPGRNTTKNVPPPILLSKREARRGKVASSFWNIRKRIQENQRGRW